MPLFDNLVDLQRRRGWGKAALAKRDSHMKAKRKHKKRHSENKERSLAGARRAAKSALAKAKQSSERAAFLSRARAYWNGEAESHP